MTGVARYSVAVKPGSKKGPLVEVADDGSLTLFVRERAVDGAANEGVVRLLADHFDVAHSTFQIEPAEQSDCEPHHA